MVVVPSKIFLIFSLLSIFLIPIQSNFQEPLQDMRRNLIMIGSTDSEDLGDEFIDILSVTPTLEQLVFSSCDELYDYVEANSNCFFRMNRYYMVNEYQQRELLSRHFDLATMESLAPLDPINDTRGRGRPSSTQ
ncbi:unnamed protein product [Absidia cylindrospora]